MIFKHLRNVRGFFSDYYFGSLFGQKVARGRQKTLSDRETDLAYARFRRLYDRAAGRVQDASSVRERFLRPLLRDVLGYHLGQGEEGLHGLYRSAEEEQARDKPTLIAYCGSWDEDLDSGRGRANPTRKTEEALSRFSLRYGLLLTGQRARLIRAPGEGPKGAHLEADLEGLSEEEDLPSFLAFFRLFSLSNFVADPQGKRPIEEIERLSREHAEKVSEDLKESVFSAARSAVSGLIADLVSRGELASPLDLDERRLHGLREAALLLLYRILFILYAEARDPRLDEHRIYRESYSAHGLLEEILRHPDRDWPENRSSFWEQLKALFYIYDQGLPPISPWDHIPPRGSDFFSPATEAGRILDSARLSDRLVARLILDLATSKPRRGVGRERISFRELDIEQLGSVYEGLLEYEPKIVKEPSIELTVQGKTYVLSPTDLLRFCQMKDLKIRGDETILQGTEAERLVRENSDGDEEETSPEDTEGFSEEGEDQRDLSSLDEDSVGPEEEDEEEDLKKGATATLIQRLHPGTFHFFPGSARKGSGSFYTPRPLVQDLVRHALGPLIEGRSASEIEKLRILDPACGSGHFLVEAMRFLGQALHRAYVKEFGGKAPPDYRSTTGEGWDENWRASDEEARASNSEARAWCKRRIAERCLYGVDLNPTAVQLARVSLWIESVAGDRPLTYFEHHIRCGNSLLGTWMERLERPPIEIRTKERKKGFPKQQGLFQDLVRNALREAARLRRIIDEANPEDLRKEGVEPESTEEQRYKDHLRKKAEEILSSAKLLFDLRSASAFLPEIWREWDMLTSLVNDLERLRTYAESRPWWRPFEEIRDRERFFHWELEFPEILLDPQNPGFDAVIGNPPWDKIKPDRKEFYGRYDVLIRAFVGGELDRRIRELHSEIPTLPEDYKVYELRVKTIANCLKKGGDYAFHDWEVEGKKTGGDPDAFKFFVERAWQVAREGGRVGFVVPSAIYNNEGSTGLRHLLLGHSRVERFYAFENRKKIFPIHSSYKFVCLVFKKGESEDEGFEASFMRHEMDELEATAKFREPGKEKVLPFSPPWVVTIRRKELEKLSPGTLAFLEYRSPRDREILLKMYGYDSEGNPINPRPLLGDQGPGTWNAKFYTEFHMTNDRDLWTDPKTGKLYNPRQILGPIPGTTDRPPYYDPSAWPEIRARMAEKGFWPLYEGKHIEQFLIDIKPIERWVSLEACQMKYGKPPDPGPKLVFRDIARNTDERTCIAAVLPEKSCANHKLPIVFSQNGLDNALLRVLNSFAFDFLVRLRSGSTSLTFSLMARIAVPAWERVAFYQPLSGYCFRGYGVDHITLLKNSWPKLWELNWLVAQAYDLGPDDFEYILSTFPVFARKRPEFYAYLLERVREWKEEIAGKTRTSAAYASNEPIALPKAAEPKKSYCPKEGGSDT